MKCSGKYLRIGLFYLLVPPIVVRVAICCVTVLMAFLHVDLSLARLIFRCLTQISFQCTLQHDWSLSFLIGGLQKQLVAEVFQNRYSEKFHNISRKTSVLKSLFDKIADLNNFIKRDSNTIVFLWILRNFYEQLFS